MTPSTLHLNYSIDVRSTVTIQRGVTRALDRQLEKELQGRGVMLVTDHNVARHYAASIADQLKGAAREVWIHQLPAGEASKSVERVQQLWSELAELRVGRDGVIVALGGGVVGDLAGFAAATFGRGMTWMQIPTTLMAQVDSSLGGKVGVNLSAGKNLIGCLWQPEHVWIDPELLATLPPREFRSGLAEVAKYAMILGKDAVANWRQQAARLVEQDRDVLESVIARCAACKLEWVRRDPHDRSGERAILNYGHTFGHALENVMGYGTLTHGEAVAIGMSLAARLALRIGWVDRDFVGRQDELLQAFGLPTRLPGAETEPLIQAMAVDKKSQAGRVRFVLPRDDREFVVTDVPTLEDVRGVLEGD
jgi:3-dehydroquinate synthase